MKMISFTLLIIAALMLTPAIVQAQAWEKGNTVLGLGIGTSKFYHIDNYYYYGHPKQHNKWYWHNTGQINLQMEFGIHKYVGLGFSTGVGGRRNRGRIWKNDEFTYQYRGEINIPIGFFANFHFYQLIADKSSKNIHADKLDIYVGANVGSGVAFTYYDNTTRTTPLAYGGLQAGIRYYFKPKVGVMAELGWGRSIANLGFVFKL